MTTGLFILCKTLVVGGGGGLRIIVLFSQLLFWSSELPVVKPSPLEPRVARQTTSVDAVVSEANYNAENLGVFKNYAPKL